MGVGDHAQWLLVEDGVHHPLSLAAEGLAAGEHLVEHHAQRPEVGGGARALPPAHRRTELGRRRRRSEDDPDSGQEGHHPAAGQDLLRQAQQGDRRIAAVTHRDPYPYYARLVAERPIYRDDSLGLWAASAE